MGWDWGWGWSREGGRERGKGEGKKVSEEIFFSNVFPIDCCSSSWIYALRPIHRVIFELEWLMIPFLPLFPSFHFFPSFIPPALPLNLWGCLPDDDEEEQQFLWFEYQLETWNSVFLNEPWRGVVGRQKRRNRRRNSLELAREAKFDIPLDLIFLHITLQKWFVFNF